MLVTDSGWASWSLILLLNSNFFYWPSLGGKRKGGGQYSCPNWGRETLSNGGAFFTLI